MGVTALPWGNIDQKDALKRLVVPIAGAAAATVLALVWSNGIHASIVLCCEWFCLGDDLA